ncbi:TIM barrel protein [Candidatus Magnetomoraceae bacterium gMMP-15]
MYPLLSKSYKNIFPFTLSCPSYIYPDFILPNVKILSLYLDEIELLFFESKASSMPSKTEIKELASIAKDNELSYNIHLPYDIFLGNPDKAARLYAVETVKRVMDLTDFLDPSTFTLHLEYGKPKNNNKAAYKETWLKNTRKSLKQIINAGVSAQTISIETLSYPFEWVEPVINDLEFSVCLDLGHLILYGNDDIESYFEKYQDKTVIIHLHGVENGKDHLSLDKMDSNILNTIIKFLKSFKGVVSLEVFSFENLKASLKCLDTAFKL